MVKMVLPEPDVQSTYKTVVKAEIEINPCMASLEIAYPSTISVLLYNKITEIKVWLITVPIIPLPGNM